MIGETKPRVLIVDDEERWRDIFEMRLKEAPTAFDVESCGGEADKEAVALSKLAANTFDIVLIDVRLKSQLDDTDVSGLLLAGSVRRTYPDVAIAVKTAYSIGAELDRWMKRHAALLEHIVDTFLVGDPGAIVVESITALLPKVVQTNFALRIDDDELPLSTIAKVFEGRSPEALREVERVLRRLYFKKDGAPSGLRLLPLVPGLSKAATFLGAPKKAHGEEVAHVIKLDDRDRSDRELANFSEYVDGLIPARRSPHEQARSHTELLGGFAISYLGLEPGELDEFGSFFKRNRFTNLDLVTKALTDFVEETCRLWYDGKHSREEPTRTWIGREFPDWQNEFRSGIEMATTSKAADNDHITLTDINQRFTNPLGLLARVPLSHSYPESITHGDANARNLLVDKKQQVWMIDFYKTGPGHIFRDFSRLEATLLFELVENRKLQALTDLSRSLAVRGDLDKPIEVSGSAHDVLELEAVARVIWHIRSLASRVAGVSDRWAEYAAICALQSLRIASYRDVPQTRRRHAVAHAAILMEAVAEETL